MAVKKSILVVFAIKDHPGPYGTLQDNKGPFWNMLDHIVHYRDHTGLCVTILVTIFPSYCKIKELNFVL